MASIYAATRAVARATTVFTMALAMTGCRTISDDGTPGPRLITVTASGPVSVTVGDTVAVVLPANPSTGFQWEVATAPDLQVLAAAGDQSYTPSTRESPMPGAGGTASFRFLAVAGGTTGITLVYRRRWETGVPPVETVTVAVTVAAGSR
jgi:inhibitor of cysteine peptidase